jgi:hypothetical protein
METGFLDGIMIIFTKGFNFPFLYIYICIGMATLKWENAQRITTVFKITPA